MRSFNAKLILISAALVVNATASSALPRCKGSPIDTSRNIGSITHVKSWSRCKGKVTYYSGAYYDGTFKNGSGMDKEPMLNGILAFIKGTGSTDFAMALAFKPKGHIQKLNVGYGRKTSS